MFLHYITGNMTNPLAQVLHDDGRIPSPHATHLSVPGKLAHANRVTDSTGYNSTVFAGKDAQLDSVMDEIDRQGFIPESLIENETKVCHDFKVHFAKYIY